MQPWGFSGMLFRSRPIIALHGMALITPGQGGSARVPTGAKLGRRRRGQAAGLSCHEVGEAHLSRNGPGSPGQGSPRARGAGEGHGAEPCGDGGALSGGMQKGARAQGWLHPHARGVILHPGSASRSRKAGITSSLGRRRRRGRKASVSPGGHLAGAHRPCRHSQSAARQGPGSPDVPEGGRRTRPPPHFTQPAAAGPGDPRESHGQAGAAGNGIQPSPPAPTASPAWKNIRFPPASPGDGSGLPPVGGDHWGGSGTPSAGAAHLDGEWSVAACAPPTAARGSHSAALGVSRRGSGGRCPLPGARPSLVALDGGCSRNKSEFLRAELGWMGGWDGGAVSNPKIALEAVPPPSRGSAWVVWRSPAPLIRH